MNNKYIEEEENRQSCILEAVKAAESQIDAFGSDDPDIQAYLLFKAGAMLMGKGSALGIDRRVMLSDMGLTQLLKLEPEQSVSLKTGIERRKCKCGRFIYVRAIDTGFEKFDQAEVCEGCFDDIEHCTCTKLSTTPVNQT